MQKNNEHSTDPCGTSSSRILFRDYSRFCTQTSLLNLKFALIDVSFPLWLQLLHLQKSPGAGVVSIIFVDKEAPEYFREGSFVGSVC